MSRPEKRVARIERETNESKVLVEVDLDGSGRTDISTGVGFYDHMLDALGRHSLIDLTVHSEGDVHIDGHHTVEDTAIVIGEALREALGDKRGIRRYGDAMVPLDEAIAQAVVDVSGRPYFVHSGEPAGQPYALIGGSGVPYAGSLTAHVLESIAQHAAITMHVHLLGGRDPHHIVEAQFKAVARALRDAIALDPRETGVPLDQGHALTTSQSWPSSGPSVTVLDYGSGNLRSAVRALERAGATVTLSRTREDAMAADGLVVPGVGAYAACMQGLLGVHGPEIIGRRLAGGRPVLGICVGMQVLFERGVEHGVETEGCGEWPGTVERLQAPVVPHMGWNTVETPAQSAMFAGIEGERFYFVHSYGVREWTLVTNDRTRPPLVTWTEHGSAAVSDRFVAAVENGPLWATQFHPEKSGDAGAALLRNWVATLGRPS